MEKAKKRQMFLVSAFWVYFFSGFGIICVFGFWPWLKDFRFLVAGILLNVLALVFWLRVVRKQSSLRADKL